MAVCLIKTSINIIDFRLLFSIKLLTCSCLICVVNLFIICANLLGLFQFKHSPAMFSLFLLDMELFIIHRELNTEFKSSQSHMYAVERRILIVAQMYCVLV